MIMKKLKQKSLNMKQKFINFNSSFRNRKYNCKTLKGKTKNYTFYYKKRRLNFKNFNNLCTSLSQIETPLLITYKIFKSKFINRLKIVLKSTTN